LKKVTQRASAEFYTVFMHWVNKSQLNLLFKIIHDNIASYDLL